jgi:hypothetical protein
MAVPMPTVLALIVCRVVLGQPDDNSAFTGWRPSEWDMSEGVMHCRRVEVELYDPSVDMGADPMPFTNMACMRAAMTQGPAFDAANANKPWRFWRAACPTPIMSDNGTPDNSNDDVVVGWKIPECPRKDGTVECEVDSAI